MYTNSTIIILTLIIISKTNGFYLYLPLLVVDLTGKLPTDDERVADKDVTKCIDDDDVVASDDVVGNLLVGDKIVEEVEVEVEVVDEDDDVVASDDVVGNLLVGDKIVEEIEVEVEVVDEDDDVVASDDVVGNLLVGDKIVEEVEVEVEVVDEDDEVLDDMITVVKKKVIEDTNDTEVCISVVIESVVMTTVEVVAVEGSRMAKFKHKSSILPLLIDALDGNLSHSKCSDH